MLWRLTELKSKEVINLKNGAKTIAKKLEDLAK